MAPRTSCCRSDLVRASDHRPFPHSLWICWSSCGLVRGTQAPHRRSLQMAKPQSTKKPLGKSALLQAVVDAVGDVASRKKVKTILDAITTVAHKQLKKDGFFGLHGFAKFMVKKKPARPARQGINPFTKQPTTFAAKPASKTVKARPVKAIKDAVASVDAAERS